MSDIRPLTEGPVHKGGHNPWPSQVTERPGPPASIRNPGPNFQSEFQLGDRIWIDGDQSIKATVIGVLFRHTGQEVEIAWIVNGHHKTAWIAAWRLTSVSE
jgi:hypothetical protein